MASVDEVKLLGTWSSPFALRARIALNLKGVRYEFLEEDLSNKSELLLKSNPIYKKIPVLIHNGKPVCESLVILNYIQDAWSSSGPSILLAEAEDRAIARFWTAYIDDKVLSPLRQVVIGQQKEVRSEALDQLRPALRQLEEVFEKCSKGKAFFNGDTIGYLDIVLGCYLGRILAAEKMEKVKLFDEETMPLLVKWVERFRSDEAVKGVMPDIDKLIDQVNARWPRIASLPPGIEV